MKAPYTALVTPGGSVLYANDASLALVGAKLNDVAGKLLWDTPLFDCAPDQRALCKQHIENVARTGIPEERRAKINDDLSLDVVVAPVYTLSGEIIALTVEGVTANHILNEREKEVLLWTARGKTAWEIASIMGISQRTVEWHATQAREKLEASNTIDAVVKAAKSGYIKP